MGANINFEELVGEIAGILWIRSGTFTRAGILGERIFGHPTDECFGRWRRWITIVAVRWNIGRWMSLEFYRM